MPQRVGYVSLVSHLRRWDLSMASSYKGVVPKRLSVSIVATSKAP